MSKKIMSLVVVFAFIFSFIGTPISVCAGASYNENDVKYVGVKPVEYAELDQNSRDQINEVLMQNGIAQEDVLSIYRYDNGGSAERITIPGWIACPVNGFPHINGGL